MKQTVNYTEYTCDLCKKSSKDDDFLQSFVLPGSYFEDTGYQGFGHLRAQAHRYPVDLCTDCANRIRKILNRHMELYMRDFMPDVTAEWRESEGDSNGK